MNASNPSADFLRLAAGKHFFVMTFKATKPDGSTLLCTRSWFAVEAAGLWLAVTAGHVVRGLREDVERGVVLSHFELDDQMAGRSFTPSGVPIFFDPHKCLAIQEAWGDYAAWVLDPLSVACLKRGGIVPMSDIAWGGGALAEYENLLLVGVPKETYLQLSLTRHEISPTIIPLRLDEDALPEESRHPNLHSAWLVQQSEIDGASVRDIDGMSGGPIFGLQIVDGEQRYFLVGVQSGWYESRRLATFYAAGPFLDHVQRHIENQKAQLLAP